MMLEKGSQDPFHWYARAMELRSLDRLEEALAAFDEVRTKFADYVPTFLMAAQVARELDRDEEAKAWARDGIATAKRVGDGHAAGELQQFLDLLD